MDFFDGVIDIDEGWNRGLSAVIRALGATLIGTDPRQVGRISSGLRAMTQMAPGGINDQAIAALENACLDIKAKALGIPVYELFGGPYRTSARAYWSHCGSFRVRNADYFADVLGTRPIQSVDDYSWLGEEAVDRGFSAAKLNPVVFGPDRPRLINPGFDPGGDLAGTLPAMVADAITDQLTAFSKGSGAGVDLLLDVNFAFKPAALKTLASVVQPFDLLWLEADVHNPSALADVRRSSATPIGSLEAVYGQRGYRPYFEKQAVDVAIVDVLWNGFFESLKIANLADAFSINFAPHNLYGPLATLMGLHLCAAAPNLQIMEVEGDDVPWLGDLLTSPPVLEAGHLLIPSAPGWGADVNEDAVLAHPAEAQS